MKVPKLMLVIILACSIVIAGVGCSNRNNSSSKEETRSSKVIEKTESTKKTKDNNKVVTTPDKTNTENKNETESTSTENKKVVVDNAKKVEENSKSSESSSNSMNDNIAEKVKSYIISGQENKSEAEKIKWSNTFLNKVDIEGLYKNYIANGGKADDVESFAKYITSNAAIPNDWKDMFGKDLYNAYGENVVRVEPLEGDLYQAYIKKDGKEVPFVVVSARTGYFHG